MESKSKESMFRKTVDFCFWPRLNRWYWTRSTTTKNKATTEFWEIRQTILKISLQILNNRQHRAWNLRKKNKESTPYNFQALFVEVLSRPNFRERKSKHKEEVLLRWQRLEWLEFVGQYTIKAVDLEEHISRNF